MYKCLLFIVSGFLWNSAAAQTTDNTDYTIWPVQQDSGLVVFAKKCYLRNSPSLSGSITDSFLLGQLLKVREITKKFDRQKGIYAPWVKVTAVNNGRALEGYVWVGSMAIGCIETAGTYFLYGIDRIETDKATDGMDYIIGLKVRNNDSLLAAVNFKTDGGEAANFSKALLLGDTKLLNLQNVIRMSFGGEACGIPTNYFYYGWTGSQLLPLPEKYSVGDAGVFYHAETLLFPNEKGGQPGKIIKLIEEEEVLEEETPTQKEKVKHRSSKEVYIWDGKIAVKKG